MYLNLFFKSVKADAAVAVAVTSAGGDAGSEVAVEGAERGERVKALIRRFLQVLVSGGGGAPEFIAGGLYLLGEVGVFGFLDCSLSRFFFFS
jgi:ribosome biogenesis protein MAK21